MDRPVLALDCPFVSAPRENRLKSLLPWLISGAALIYVFGFVTDWQTLMQQTRGANLPLFIAVSFADKLLFFLGWTFLQIIAIRRLVGDISMRSLFSIRGGSELMRAVSNPLADATFLVGLVHLTGGNPARVLVAASIPAFVHTTVMLLQVTLAAPFLDGGLLANRDVMITIGIGWAVVISVFVSVRFLRTTRFGLLSRIREGLRTINLRDFTPMLYWFLVLAAFDVFIQGMATRAFGTPIPWAALAARIPILYVALSIPSFGNFGTRELAWSALFGDFAERDALVAYALATNTIFLLANVAIGVLFLPRAIELVREVRRARREGEEVPTPPVRDPAEP